MKLEKVLLLLAIVSVAANAGAAGERLAVVSNVANVRAAPQTNAVVLWQVEKHYPVINVEKKGEWYRIQDFEGDQGWMHASVLGNTPTVIVKANQCNIRTGPGTRHDIAFTVNKGIPFRVLQTKGAWLEVQHADGDTGWVNKELVW